MSTLVTGVAGFVGSHLAERLVQRGHDVVGIDSFTDYYPKAAKQSNISGLRHKERFTLIQRDINAADLRKLLKPVDHVFHLAAQPGVRPSWGKSFDRYLSDNILATQRLLEACKESKVKKFVYSSSSSVYGDAESLPTPETNPTRPISPYGATKLAAEHLCRLYNVNFNVPVVILRYFTVYGPRQRPDMAFNRFIRRIRRGEEIEVLGDGQQSRDFTYVEDAVNATLLAQEAKDGTTYNVGSGTSTALVDAISVLESVIHEKVNVIRAPSAAGDVVNTRADISKIQDELGFEMKTPLRVGLEKQVAWQKR